jgi:hypothetical protein
MQFARPVRVAFRMRVDHRNSATIFMRTLPTPTISIADAPIIADDQLASQAQAPSTCRSDVLSLSVLKCIKIKPILKKATTVLRLQSYHNILRHDNFHND